MTKTLSKDNKKNKKAKFSAKQLKKLIPEGKKNIGDLILSKLSADLAEIAKLRKLKQNSKAQENLRKNS